MEKAIYENKILEKYKIKREEGGQISEDSELILWTSFKKGDDSLRDYFILKYSPLVKYVAGRIAINIPDSVEFEDLVSFGMFGLIDAIEKFDPHKGIKFKTYGITRIRGQIYDELRSLDWVPRSIRQKYKEIEDQKKRYFEENNEPMPMSKIAESLGIEEKDVQKTLSLVSNSSVGSLNDTWIIGSDDSEISLIESVQAPMKYNPYDKMEKDEIQKTIAQEISKLPEKEKKVLILYYHEDLTLKEIGAVLNVTESRVSQLHTNAIRDIRSALEKIKKSLV